MSTTSCTIPLSTLRAAPFDLLLGDSIDFQVRASNAYGSSQFSELGGAALIQSVPDAPVEVTVDAENTSATKISFKWVDGA
jgi:hypothetical protein